MRATDDKVTGSEKAGEMERIAAQINRVRMRERGEDLISCAWTKDWYLWGTRVSNIDFILIH